MTKKRSIGILVLDILMVLGFVILFDQSAFGGLAFHEIAGLCICGALIAHIILNRKGISGFPKKFGSASVKTKIEYILALLLLIDLVVVAVTGILISKLVFANILSVQVNAESLHAASSYLALMLMGLHIGLAWDQVCAMTRNIFGIKETPKSAGAVLTAAAVLIFAAGIYNVSTTHYFDKVFSFTGSREPYGTLPDGNNGPFERNGQTDQSSPDSGAVSPSTTAAATTGYTAVGMTSSASVQQGSGGSGLTDESDSGNRSDVTGSGSDNSNNAPSFAGGRGGEKGAGGGMPQGGGGPGSDNAPTGKGDAQFGNGEGFGQMKGERGAGTAATAAENLSILGMFAVLAYYLEKLLQKKRSEPVEGSGGAGDDPERALAQAALEDTASSETIAEVEEAKSEPADNAVAADPEPEEK